MLNCRQLAILGGVTAAAVVAAVALSGDPARHVAAGAGQPMFPELKTKANDAATLVVEGKTAKATVVRGADGTWTVAEKGGYPADAALVRKNVLGLVGMKAVEPKTAVPDLHSRLDLADLDKKDSKAKRLVLKDTAGKDLAALLVGKTKIATTTDKPGLLYVRRPGEPQTWLAEARLDVAADPLTWMEKEMPQVKRERVKSVAVVHPDGKTIAASRADAKTEDFQAAGLPEGAKPNQSEINSLAGALAFPSFDDVAKADTVAFDKAVKTIIATFDGLQLTVSIATKDGKAWARFEAAVDAGAADAQKTEAKRIADRFAPWAYQLSEFQAKSLTKRPEDLIEKAEKK